MHPQLSGKTAIVSGASKGIGLAVTQALAGEPAAVVAGARDLTAELSELAYVQLVLWPQTLTVLDDTPLDSARSGVSCLRLGR